MGDPSDKARSIFRLIATKPWRALSSFHAQDGGRRLIAFLEARQDIAGLAVFRALFGALLFFGVLRFAMSGWIHVQYGKPTHVFRYYGFSWIPVLDEASVTTLVVVLLVASAFIALGLLTRASIVVFFFGFAWIEFIDVTNYLNHYVLVLWLLFFMAFLPMGAAFSVDAKLWPHRRRNVVPRFAYVVLRAQVAFVYVFAAVAKMGPDWLLHGQPLGIWLQARSDVPVVGVLFALPLTALLMSWGGFLYDLTIVGWLSWARTRFAAYFAVLVFHSSVGVLFDIGMFPGIMMISTLLFFAPAWPRVVFRLVRTMLPRTPPSSPLSSSTISVRRAQEPTSSRLLVRALAAFAMVLLTAQVLFPLRAFVYDGNVLWHEQGMRYAWRVMVREKNGAVTYRVTTPSTGRRYDVSPHAYLEWRQVVEMSGQPDLILQLAHIIRDDFHARGHGDVEVRADAWVSLNGRKKARLIDPDVDLAVVDDGVAVATYILPAPLGPPLGGGS